MRHVIILDRITMTIPGMIPRRPKRNVLLLFVYLLVVGILLDFVFHIWID